MATKKKTKKNARPSLPSNPTIHVHPFLRAFPTSLKLGIHRVKILLSLSPEHNHNAFGRFNGDTDTITISACGPVNTPEKALEVLLHEAAHAIDSHNQTYIKGDRDISERVAQIHGMGYTQIIIQNPELLKWVRKYIK